VDSDDDQESESRSPQHQVASRKRARRIVDSDDDQESESRSPQHQVASKRLDVAEHGERELIELATVSSLYDAEVGLIGTCSN